MKLVKLTIWFAVCVSFASADVVQAQNRRIVRRLGTPPSAQPKSESTATGTDTQVETRATHAQKMQQLQEDNRESAEYNRQRVIAERALIDKKMDLFQYLDWLKETMDSTEKRVGVEGKPFFNACRKLRETCAISNSCNSSDPSLDVCRAGYTSPFLSKRSRLDDQLRVQMFAVRSYFDFRDAFIEWAALAEKTGEQTKLDVICAISEGRGRQYESDYWKYRFKRSGKAPVYSLPIGQVEFYHLWKNYNKVSSEALSAAQREKDMEAWRDVLATLSGQQKPAITNPQGAVFKRALHYVLGGGGTIGHQGNPMPTPDEFQFIWRDNDAAFARLRNPSKELRTNNMRFTYWKRDAEPGQPALVLKVQVPQYTSYKGSGGTCNLSNHLAATFLAEFCDWGRELENFLQATSEGISRGVVNAVREGTEVQGYLADADKAWLDLYSAKRKELYQKYFFTERLKWYRISAEEYAKLKAHQVEWLTTHNSKDYVYKNGLCAVFEKLAPTYDNDGSSTSSLGKYSSEALKSALPAGVAKASPTTAPK